MQQFKSFQEWFNATAEAKGATAVGRRMLENKFAMTTTGGHCLAWERYDATKKFQILVTVSEEETQPSDELGTDLADIENAMWIVGVYDDDGGWFGDEVKGLTAALALAEKFVAEPQKYILNGETI